MGLFSKKPQIDPEELRALRHDFTDLRQRLDVSERSKADLEVQLRQLGDVTTSLSARSDRIDDVALRLNEVEVLKRQIAQIDEAHATVKAKVQALDGLNGKLAELADRVTATSDDAKQATDQTTALHQRISNVTTELANQLGELSNEIDGLASSRASAAEPIVAEQPFAAEVIDQLRSSQVRLANEQVRYEIAFRQDLALLAAQVERARHQH